MIQKERVRSTGFTMAGLGGSPEKAPTPPVRQPEGHSDDGGEAGHPEEHFVPREPSEQRDGDEWAGDEAERRRQLVDGERLGPSPPCAPWR